MVIIFRFEQNKINKMPKTELFVGNLGKEVSKKDVEDVFDKYGRIVRCDVKSKGFGSSFCFLEFEDERDAEVIHLFIEEQLLMFHLLFFYILFLLNLFRFFSKFFFN
jgi:hypothetical protein